MADAGRTTWLPRDAAEHDRELIVILKEEFGADGPYTITVLKDLAQQQRSQGCVLTGFRSLRSKTGVADPERQRVIVERAAEIGQLDDFMPDGDGLRFSCRISGWSADQETGRASFRKAAQRANADDSESLSRSVTVGHGPSQNVPLTEQNRTEQETAPADPSSLDDARARLRSEQVQSVFGAWLASTERDPARTKLTPDRRRQIEKALASHGVDDCLAAVTNIGADEWARGANDRQRRFDDIGHALSKAERIEHWRDRTPASKQPSGHEATRTRRAAALASLQGGAA